MKKTLFALAFIPMAAHAWFWESPDYDLHKKSLVPIVEKAKPEGGKMAFVKDGRLDFAIVTEARTYGNELKVLQKAFLNCFGAEAPVVNLQDAKCKTKAEDFKYLVLLGDQPKVKELGIDVMALPEQGFVIRTFGNGVVIAGRDSHLIPGYNRHPLDKLPRYSATNSAVLDFTERFLGVRYYFITDLGKIYPKRKDFTLFPVWYEDAPFYRTRGNNYGFYYPTATPSRAAHYEPYLGKFKPGDTSMYGLWRLGGSRPGHGKHYPDPQQLGKVLTPEEREQVFFKDDQGKLWYNAGNHFGNYFEPIRLDGFAKMYMDKVKEYFDTDGKSNPWNFNFLVNNTYVNFGVCDSMAQPRDYVNNPIVRELGLCRPEDEEFVKKENRAHMRNIYGRLYQYLANRLKADCPGKRLYVMNYYNSLWAPTDPRWALPDNVEAIVCDGCLLTWACCPKIQERSRALFGGWSKALQGRPVSMAYLYNCGNPIACPFAQQQMGEVPKILGETFGRDGIFFDGGINYHTFWGYYIAALAQWNPDIDAEAATDEAFDLCCGPEAGAYLKEFYHTLKPIVLRDLRLQKHQTDLTVAEIDALMALLDKARAAVKPGTDEAKRVALLCDYWPPHFEHIKVVSAYRNPAFDVKRVKDADVTLDGKADEAFWAAAATMPMRNSATWKDAFVPASCKLVWTEKGLYGYFESAEKPFQKPDKDMWTNDTLEFFVSQGNGCEEFHQFAFDSLGRRCTLRKRVLPIPQPFDDQFKPADFKFANQVTDGRWTAEFFVPFDCFWHPEAPKAGDTWRCTFVKTRVSDPKQLDGTAMTLGNNGNMKMYDEITFR